MAVSRFVPGLCTRIGMARQAKFLWVHPAGVGGVLARALSDS